MLSLFFFFKSLYFGNTFIDEVIYLNCASNQYRKGKNRGGIAETRFTLSQ